MSVAAAGSALVCTGTTAISGPVDVVAVKNDATTSYTITKGANTIDAGGAGSGAVKNIPFRTSGGITVTVVGGGSVTLYLRVSAGR